MRHTPEPWEWTKDGLCLLNRARDEAILNHKADWKPTKANRDLTAAAPNLLEAALLVSIEFDYLTKWPNEDTRKNVERAIRKLRTAIAKAEGREVAS